MRAEDTEADGTAEGTNEEPRSRGRPQPLEVGILEWILLSTPRSGLPDTAV